MNVIEEMLKAMAKDSVAQDLKTAMTAALIIQDDHLLTLLSASLLLLEPSSQYPKSLAIMLERYGVKIPNQPLSEADEARYEEAAKEGSEAIRNLARELSTVNAPSSSTVQ